MVIALKLKGYVFSTRILMTLNGCAEINNLPLTKILNKWIRRRKIQTIRSRLENINTKVVRREQSWMQYKLDDDELKNGS